MLTEEMFLYFLLYSFFAFIGYIVLHRIKMHLSRQMLSYPVAQHKMKAKNAPLRHRLRLWLGLQPVRLPYPSRQAVILWATVLFVIFLIVPFKWTAKLFPALPASAGQIFGWSLRIQIGLTAAIVPIIVLLVAFAERLTRVALRPGEVLLRETYFYPIIIYDITALILFLFVPIFAEMSAALALRGAFTCGLSSILAIFLYYKAARLGLELSEFQEKDEELLFENTQEEIDAQIAREMTGEILRNYITSVSKELSIDIKYIPLAFEAVGNEYSRLRAKKTGRVKDVNLTKLGEFAGKLSAFQNECKGQIKAQIPQVEPESLIQLRPTYFCATIGDNLGDQDNILCLVDKRILDTGKIAELEELLRSVYSVGKASKDKRFK